MVTQYTYMLKGCVGSWTTSVVEFAKASLVVAKN